MTREVTDNLYIDLGYFTPEEYYTYEANAEADFASAATFICVTTAGSVKDFTADFAATASQSATATRIKQFDVEFTGVFTPNMTVIAIKNLGSTMSVVATMSVSVERNRAVDIALDTIANISAQSARTRDLTSGLSVSATLSAQLTKLVLVNFAATLTSTVSLTCTGKDFVISSPVVFRGVGKPEINYTVTKFGAGSLFLNGSSYLYAADRGSRFNIANPDADSDSNFAQEIWVYPTSAISSNERFIVGQWEGNSSSTQSWKIVQTPSLGIQWVFRVGTSTTTSLSATSVLNINAWNHIVVVRRRVSSTSTTWALFVNGTNVANGSGRSALWSGAGGQVRIGYSGESSSGYFQGYIDGFNFRNRGSAALAYFPTSPSLTVPTAEYTSGSTFGSSVILLNFNDNYLDQSEPNNVTFASALTSAFTQTVTARKVIIANSALTSAATLSATIGKLVNFNANLPVIATQLSAVGKIGQAVIACDVVASLSASGNRQRNAVSALTSAFTQTANAEASKEFDSDLSSTATLSVQSLVTKGAVATLTSAFTQSTVVARTRDVASNQTAQVTLSAQAIKNVELQSALAVTASLACDISRTRPFAVDLPVVATQLTAAAKIGVVLVACDAVATLSATVTSGKIVIANLNSTVTLTASTTRTRTALSSLQVQANLSAVNTRTRTLVSTQNAVATQSATATITKRIASNLSASFTLQAQSGGLQLFQANLTAQASQSAQINVRRSATAILPVIASQLTVGTDTNRAQANLVSTFTLQCTVIEVRIDPDLTYMVPKETRSYMIIEELRNDTVVPEFRTHDIDKELRGYTVLNTEEEYII